MQYEMNPKLHPSSCILETYEYESTNWFLSNCRWASFTSFTSCRSITLWLLLHFSIERSQWNTFWRDWIHWRKTSTVIIFCCSTFSQNHHIPICETPGKKSPCCITKLMTNWTDDSPCRLSSEDEVWNVSLSLSSARHCQSEPHKTLHVAQFLFDPRRCSFMSKNSCHLSLDSYSVKYVGVVSVWLTLILAAQENWNIHW